MKWADWKILLTFLFSPFLGGIVYSLISSFFDPPNNKLSFLDLLIIAIFISTYALIIFFIPAIAVGIIYLKTIKWNRFFQEMLCCAMGFIFPALWANFVFSKSYLLAQYEFYKGMGYIGMITALLISIILNHKKKRKYLSS